MKKNTMKYLTKEKYWRKLYFIKESDCNRFVYNDKCKGTLTTQGIFDDTICFDSIKEANKWIKKHSCKGSSIDYTFVYLEQKDIGNKYKWTAIEKR